MTGKTFKEWKITTANLKDVIAKMEREIAILKQMFVNCETENKQLKLALEEAEKQNGESFIDDYKKGKSDGEAVGLSVDSAGWDDMGQ
jgi:hypothetical protein